MTVGFDGIKGAGMTYQGSSSTAREIAQPKVERQENVQVSQQLNAAAVSLDTKSASEQGAYQQEQSAEQRNAQIRNAVDEVNHRAKNTEAIFGIHEGTNRVTIKIIDRATKKVIKELPPEKTLDMIEKVWEMAGLLVDEKR